MSNTTNDRLDILENKVEALTNTLEQATQQENAAVYFACAQLLTRYEDEGRGFFMVSRFSKNEEYIKFTHLVRFDEKLADPASMKKKDDQPYLDFIRELESSGDYMILYEEIHKDSFDSFQMLGMFQYKENPNNLFDFTFDTTKLKDKGKDKDKPEEKVVTLASRRQKEGNFKSTPTEDETNE